MNRKEIENSALERIALLNELQAFEKSAERIIEKYGAQADPRDIRDAQYRAIAKRFFLYFCGMSAELQNEILCWMLDRHCPESPGEFLDVQC